MATAMRVEVDGVEISPEKVTRSHGWKTAGEKIKQNGAKAQSDVSANVNGQAADFDGATGGFLR